MLRPYDSSVSVVIPAYNEQRRVGATITAARSIPGVTEVIVVDDGSSDATAREGAQAGAVVLRAPHRGKGAALRRGVAVATAELVLLLDADLGESAAGAAPLVQAVRDDLAELAIAVLPAPRKRPGFGIALGAARLGLWLLTGRRFAAPLSGQRCMPLSLARTLPWVRGFGAEVAATADAAALGARIAEVPTDLKHAPTGRTFAGFVHRARQFAAVVAALGPRALYPITPAACLAPPRRVSLALCAWALLAALGWLIHPMGLVALGAAGFAVAAVALSLAINEWASFCRPNYRGRKIPAAGGLGFVVGPLAAWGALAARGDSDARFLGWCGLAVLIMAAAGMADDAGGSRDVSGLAGHLSSLLRGRVTTGAVKAAAGALVGLTVGWVLARPSIAGTLLNAAVIALGANLVNLLDVRPGRAVKGFLLLCAIAVAADVHALYAVAPIGVIALAFAPLDLGGRAMMGDTGANALGVAAGIALAAALPLWWRVALLAGLVGIHLYSEFCSITALIARAPVLRWVDRLGRAEDGGE